MPDHVFAYGSLADEVTGVACELRGVRRVWGVAMDNAVTIAGYKEYRDLRGARPDVCVAFLDLERADDDPAAAVNGVCVPVDATALAALDRRERNYVRVEVTADVEGAPPGRVWAFTGRADARARLRDARAAGRAVVQRAYARSVEAAFARLGEAALERFRATTLPHGLPELDLRRVDLPVAAS